MPRLGELLAATRLIAPELVDQALRAQVVWGGRLGTNLVELGCLELDGLSRALGRQHGLPAALSRHFDKADAELQTKLAPELARRYSVVPLLRVGADRKIALAALDPLPADALVAIADAFGCSPTKIVVSVAAEMRIRYHLERVYGVARAARFLRTRGKTANPFPELALEIPVEIEDEDSVPSAGTPLEPIKDKPTGRAAVAPPPTNADDLAAQIDEAIAQSTDEHVPTGRERRTYVKTLADAVEAALAGPTVTSSFNAMSPEEIERLTASEAEDGIDAATLGRIPIKRVALTTAPSISESRDSTSLQDATKRIRRGPNRDRVADLVIDALVKFVPSCQAALLLVVRGDVAIGWKHFCRDGNSNSEIAVPLEQPGLVPTALNHNVTARAAASELGAIDQLLLRALGGHEGDLIVVPISIGGRVMCLLAVATDVDGVITAVEAIASSAGTAFARLIRDASR